MSTSAPPAPSRIRVFVRPGFHLQMAYASAVIVLVSVLGCPLTGTHVPDVGTMAIGLAAVAVVLVPLLLYLEERGLRKKWQLYVRDSLLTILWALFFTLMLGYPVTVAARLGMGIGLQDAHFIQWDGWLGVNVAAISAWASNHRLGILVNRTYNLLFPYMRLAILLPVFAGKIKYAQKFLIANLAAFAIGLPVFVFFPGVGPWFGLHLAARPDQAACQALVLLIRQPGPYLYQYPAGVICFPSFHVIWAMLCAYALWGFRWLRIPALLFSALIVFSTMTIGNHYLCDVLAGMVLGIAAIVIAEWHSRRATG